MFKWTYHCKSPTGHGQRCFTASMENPVKASFDDWKGAFVWLEAEVGDAVTRLELPEKSGTVVRNSEAVSSCSGQRRQCTYARTHARMQRGKTHYCKSENPDEEDGSVAPRGEGLSLTIKKTRQTSFNFMEAFVVLY